MRVRRGQSARKSNADRARARLQQAKGMDAKQCAMFAGAVFIAIWGITATVLLLRLGIMYTFDSVMNTRKEYITKGAADWAKTVATKDLREGIEVWNLLNNSIAGLVYRAPEDYTNLGNVLSPAFVTMPSLHSVELAFSDREASVSLTRKAVADRDSILMQSTAKDCFLMGGHGCVPPPSTPLYHSLTYGERPLWYGTAIQLGLSPYGGSFRWESEPDLVVEVAEDGGAKLSPCIRLLVKLIFPTHGTPAKANYIGVDGLPKVRHYTIPTIVTGRITVKLDRLSGERLVDGRLGDKGKMFLVDASGVLLSSRERMDLVVVENGLVRMKKCWEVDGDWWGDIRSAFREPAVASMLKDSDKTCVAVEPLDAPLQRFAAVVVAPSLFPFQNSPLIVTAGIAALVGPAPYVLGGAVAVVLFASSCLQTMKKAEKAVEGPGGVKRARASISGLNDEMNGSPPGSPNGRRSSRRSFTQKVASRMPSWFNRKTRTS